MIAHIRTAATALLASAVFATAAVGQPFLDSWRLPPINDISPALSQPSGEPLPHAGLVEEAEPPAEAVPPGVPLAEDVIPQAAGEPAERIWLLPSAWLPPVEWEGGLEAGINGTEGNAEALSMRFGAELTRKTEVHEIGFELNYIKATAEGVETQHAALFDAGYERFLGDSPWTFFSRMELAYDEFKAFDLRLVLNTGLGYQFIKTDITTLEGRIGSGVSHEFGGPDDAWVPEAVFGADFERQLSKRQKLKLTVDYFPEWNDFQDYRLVSDLGWEVLLDEAHDLSFKVSLIDRYDSTPNGLEPNDVYYSLLLLWKL